MAYNVIKIASCILNECDGLSTMKLQKLVYYSQALCLVRTGSPLFEDAIEAWANGPVVPKLFHMHRGRFVLRRGFFDGDNLETMDKNSADVVRDVLSVFGSYSGAQLSELTHKEAPWLLARAGMGPSERGNQVIDQRDIQEYYSSPGCRNPLFAR